MMKNILLLSICILLQLTILAQESQSWQGKTCAVVLTYDDALNVHLDNALRALDSLGLKATFYLSGYSKAVDARIPEWRAAALSGHELGNHTLFHPCTGGPGRSFVKPDYDLNNYTVSRMVNEVQMTNILLKSIDGKTEELLPIHAATPGSKIPSTLIF